MFNLVVSGKLCFPKLDSVSDKNSIFPHKVSVVG